MIVKGQCPTCGRTCAVLASGGVRKHNNAETGIPCPGGVPAGTATIIDASELGQVLQLRPQGQKRGGKKAARMSDDEKKAANAARPDSKGLDRNGYGACNAKSADPSKPGERCALAKGQGTDHVGFGRCKRHGGSSANGKKHAALERAQAELARVKGAMTFYGHRTLVDPEQALLEEMQRSVGAVRWLEQAIGDWGRFERMAAEMTALDPASDDDARDKAMAFLDRLTRRTESWRADGTLVETEVSLEDPTTGMPSLVAIHSTDHAVGFTDTEYAAWLKVYQAERKHLAWVAKACIEANIAERRQAVLEARGDMIRSLVVIALKLAGVTLDETRMLEIIAQATRTVTKELTA